MRTSPERLPEIPREIFPYRKELLEGFGPLTAPDLYSKLHQMRSEVGGGDGVFSPVEKKG